MISIDFRFRSSVPGRSERARMPFPIHGRMLGGLSTFAIALVRTPPKTATLFRRMMIKNCYSRTQSVRRVRKWLAYLAKPFKSVFRVARRVNLTTLSTYHPTLPLISALDSWNQITYVQPNRRIKHDRNIHYTQLYINKMDKKINVDRYLI